MIPVLAVVSALLAYLLYRERGRRAALVRAANAEYRVALDFIAEEFAEMPHEFAAIFMAGNRIAMEEKFPDYFDFRAASLSRHLGQPEGDDA